MRGKAIYNPSGKAGEYSYWAVNFYNGCSANCDYCYCKKGVMSHLWSTTPTLKKSLLCPSRAIEIFKKEARDNLDELRHHGLFFNFTSDPFLRETIGLNYEAMQFCNGMDIPVKALTKQTWWIHAYELPDNVSIGYTLTGMDDMEPGAAYSADRIRVLQYFRESGYKTWASIEPVIDMQKSIEMIAECRHFANHFKIGPLSGKKFSKDEIEAMVFNVAKILDRTGATVYWKEGFIEAAGIERNRLPGNSVSRDYRWWAEGGDS